MQRIDLTDTQHLETIEIMMPSGTVRVQVNAMVGGMRSDVVQVDVNRAASQTVTSGSDFIKVVRRLKSAFKLGGARA